MRPDRKKHFEAWMEKFKELCPTMSGEKFDLMVEVAFALAKINMHTVPSELPPAPKSRRTPRMRGFYAGNEITDRGENEAYWQDRHKEVDHHMFRLMDIHKEYRKYERHIGNDPDDLDEQASMHEMIEYAKQAILPTEAAGHLKLIHHIARGIRNDGLGADELVDLRILAQTDLVTGTPEKSPGGTLVEKIARSKGDGKRKR